MSPLQTRALRCVITIAGLSYLTAGGILATDADKTFPATLWMLPPLRALGAGAIAGIVWTPLLSWSRLPLWGAALAGLPAGLTTLLCFFFVWPHPWQAGRGAAWKPAGIVATTYWYLLVPAGLIGGMLTALWCRRVPLPRWEAALRSEDPAPTPKAGAPEGPPPAR
jgi:hypothetical protein